MGSFGSYFAPKIFFFGSLQLTFRVDTIFFRIHAEKHDFFWSTFVQTSFCPRAYFPFVLPVQTLLCPRTDFLAVLPSTDFLLFCPHTNFVLFSHKFLSFCLHTYIPFVLFSHTHCSALKRVCQTISLVTCMSNNVLSRRVCQSISLVTCIYV